MRKTFLEEVGRMLRNGKLSQPWSDMIQGIAADSLLEGNGQLVPELYGSEDLPGSFGAPGLALGEAAEQPASVSRAAILVSSRRG